jgi:hypothetical protein
LLGHILQRHEIIGSARHLERHDRDSAISLHSVHELENTRRKLQELEAEYVAATNRTFDNVRVREATLNSLRRLINQLKEEIARFEARQPTRR